MHSVQARHPFYDLEANTGRGTDDIFKCDATRAEYLTSIGYVLDLGETEPKTKPSAASANTKKAATRAPRKKKSGAAR